MLKKIIAIGALALTLLPMAALAQTSYRVYQTSDGYNYRWRDSMYGWRNDSLRRINRQIRELRQLRNRIARANISYPHKVRLINRIENRIDRLIDLRNRMRDYDYNRYNYNSYFNMYRDYQDVLNFDNGHRGYMLEINTDTNSNSNVNYNSNYNSNNL